MARVKRGVTRTKRRKNILKKAKGFSRGRKNITREAKQAVKKAGQRAYDHRKLKKRTTRSLWQVKISAASKSHGISYSKLMGALTKAEIEIDRKVLATIAEKHPKLFAEVVKAANVPAEDVKEVKIAKKAEKPAKEVKKDAKK